MSLGEVRVHVKGEYLNENWTVSTSCHFSLHYTGQITLLFRLFVATALNTNVQQVLLQNSKTT